MSNKRKGRRMYMQDLSLHLLDIAENSIRARAKKIIIELNEAISNNKLSLKISDDGEGMSQQMIQIITNPFVTTRTTRRVGLGIPLLYQNCLNAGGTLEIHSVLGKGTVIEAVMQYNHIDRLPVGDMASSLIALIQGNPYMEFIYTHVYEDKTFIFNTSEIKQVLGAVAINEPEIIQWLKSYIAGYIASLYR